MNNEIFNVAAINATVNIINLDSIFNITIKYKNDKKKISMLK